MKHIGSVKYLYFLFCTIATSTGSGESYLRFDYYFSKFCPQQLSYTSCSNFTSDDVFVLVSKSKIFNDDVIVFQDALLRAIPKQIFSVLPSLEILFVNNCNLSYFIHSTFGAAHKLKMLNLNGNQLKFLLGNTFRGARQLQTLSLNDNQIIVIDNTAFFGLDNLEVLSLSGNNISQLEQNTFSHLPNLKLLNVSNNQVEFLDDLLLTDCSKLKNIDFSYNMIKVVGENIFSQIPYLLRLDLSSNSIKNLALNLQRVIALNADSNLVLENVNIMRGTVEQLFLQNNRIVTMSVARAGALNEVNLMFNQLDDISSLYFAFNLRQLNLAGNKLQHISRNQLKNMSKLEVLNLQFNDINKLDPDALKSQTVLRKLDISYNYLRSIYVDLLINCPNIEMFNFNGNFLQCKNIYQLLTSLSSQVTYKTDDPIDSDVTDSLAMINGIYCRRNPFDDIDDDKDRVGEILQAQFDDIVKFKQKYLENLSNKFKKLKSSLK